MKRFMLSFIILANLVCVVYAQDTTFTATEIRRNYNRNAIYFKQPFLGGGLKYIKNGIPCDVGFFYGNLVDAVYEVPEAEKYAKEGSKKVVIGLLTSIIGIPTGMTLVLVGGANNDTGFISLGALTYISSLLFSRYMYASGYSNIHKAIWMYNREVTLRP